MVSILWIIVGLLNGNRLPVEASESSTWHEQVVVAGVSALLVAVATKLCCMVCSGPKHGQSPYRCMYSPQANGHC